MNYESLPFFDVPLTTNCPIIGEPAFGRSRHRDPVTSHKAARAQRGGLSDPILAAFQTGPLSDDELVALLPQFHGPSVRTCRSRLSKAGLLVATDERRLSVRGHEQIVWATKFDGVW